jgi:hypothetical protein
MHFGAAPPRAEEGRAARPVMLRGARRECGALRQFVRLETLIVDKNSLESLEMFPVMPTVHTLWVNNNRVRAVLARLRCPQ